MWSRSTTGIKRNILRLLNDCGCSVTVVPATASAAESILALRPDGVFLSNGPGDPAETGGSAVPIIKSLLETRIPLFGICLGHQLLGLAVGGRTVKMAQGHHGANHPVKDFTTNKVEIVSMNHGFAVDRDTLPANVKETHVSLFDGSNCGVALTDRPAFSVQYHPEASPGPRDSHYLFRRFVDADAGARGGGDRARCDGVRILATQLHFPGFKRQKLQQAKSRSCPPFDPLLTVGRPEEHGLPVASARKASWPGLSRPPTRSAWRTGATFPRTLSNHYNYNRLRS